MAFLKAADILTTYLEADALEILSAEVSATKSCIRTNILATAPYSVRRVNFTGSDRVGRIIAGWAAECLKKFVLELGGKAPVIVLEDANLEGAVVAVVFGSMANAGQICMSTERVIVHQTVAAEFKRLLLVVVRGLKVVNHGEDDDVVMSGLYTPFSAVRTILAPHILEEVTPDMDIFQHESFGPLLCLSEFDREECREEGQGQELYIEAPLPNGGLGGSSSYDRFGGMAGVEEFTERKIISMAQPGMKYAF